MTNWTPDISTIGGPRYRAIADALARDISDRVLPPGTRLPTHRDLAYKLGVTVGTVTRAYAEAERRGLIEGEVGRGTYVRDQESGNRSAIRYSRSSTGALVELGINVSSAPGVADSLKQMLQEVTAQADLNQLMDYSNNTLPPAHMNAAANWLERRFNLPRRPDWIRMTNGAQHALLTAFLTLCRPGDLVATETLTYSGMRHLANTLGLRLEGLAYDDDGLIPDALDACCRQRAPRVLYTVPTLHNPTTAILPEARRIEIASICRRYGVQIIEDDVFGFLPDEQLPRLATLAPDITLYITSLSKCIATGFRVGYIVGAPGLVERVDSAMLVSQSMGSLVMSELATRLIDSGEADKLADRQKEEAAARQEIATDLLAGFDYLTKPKAQHLWLRLPLPWRREEFVSEARRRGVSVTPADYFTVGHAPSEQSVRISLSQPQSREQVETGLRIIADILAGQATLFKAVI